MSLNVYILSITFVASIRFLAKLFLYFIGGHHDGISNLVGGIFIFGVSFAIIECTRSIHSYTSYMHLYRISNVNNRFRYRNRIQFFTFLQLFLCIELLVIRTMYAKEKEKNEHK